MRILQIGKFYPLVGGVEKVMYEITTGLSEKGIDCDMLCAKNDNAQSDIVNLNPHGKLICCKSWITAS